MDSYCAHLTQLERKTWSCGVVAASKAEGYYEFIQTPFMWLEEDGPWHCKLCGKCATESHITSTAHMKQVQLSTAISWMCGGVPLSLKVRRIGGHHMAC